MTRCLTAALALALAACSGTSAPDTVPRYDLVIRNGTVYDGSGAPGQRVDVAVQGDRIAALLAPGTQVE